MNSLPLRQSHNALEVGASFADLRLARQGDKMDETTIGLLRRKYQEAKKELSIDNPERFGKFKATIYDDKFDISTENIDGTHKFNLELTNDEAIHLHALLDYLFY